MERTRARLVSVPKLLPASEPKLDKQNKQMNNNPTTTIIKNLGICLAFQTV